MEPLTNAECMKRMLAKVPPDCDRAIVIYPTGDQTSCAWYGMPAESVVRHLYQIADEIVGQRCMPSQQQRLT